MRRLARGAGTAWLIGLGGAFACGRTGLELGEAQTIDPGTAGAGRGGHAPGVSSGGASLQSGGGPAGVAGMQRGGESGLAGAPPAGGGAGEERGGSAGASGAQRGGSAGVGATEPGGGTAGAPGGGEAGEAGGAGAPPGACSPIEVDCAGECVDTSRDRSHCGECYRPCPDDTICVLGECRASCESPRVTCGEACVDLTSDAAHCGQCNAACPPEFGCFDGICHRLQRLTCEDLLVDVEVWGVPGRGLELRPYTSSTLHWIGCTPDGCSRGEFYCEDTATTLAFGARRSVLRAVVDRNDALGDDMPRAPLGCATPEDPFGKYNGPHPVADQGGIDSIAALCRTLGYARGELVREETNYCPKPHALDASGTRFGSDLAQSSGAGAEYLCTLEAVPDPVAAR